MTRLGIVKHIWDSKLRIRRPYLCDKRSINPAEPNLGRASSCEEVVRSSTATRLRNPQQRMPLVSAQVHGAATRRAPDRWHWQSRPNCTVERWGVSLSNQFFLPITKGRIARFAALVSIGKPPSSAYRLSLIQLLAR